MQFLAKFYLWAKLLPPLQCNLFLGRFLVLSDEEFGRKVELFVNFELKCRSKAAATLDHKGTNLNFTFGLSDNKSV